MNTRTLYLAAMMAMATTAVAQSTGDYLLQRKRAGVGFSAAYITPGAFGLLGFDASGNLVNVPQATFDVAGAAAAAEATAAGYTDAQLAAQVHDAADITTGEFADPRISFTSVAQYQGSLSIDWAQLTSVPGTFTPGAHAHVAADITDFNSVGDARWSLLGHAHTIANVTALTDSLNVKQRRTDLLGAHDGRGMDNHLFPVYDPGVPVHESYTGLQLKAYIRNGFGLWDADGDHLLLLSANESYTADRTLQLLTGDADRILTLTDDATLSGTNTGDNAPNTLYSGLVSNATHTGDVTGATALTIANDAVTNTKAANMAQASVKGRAAAAGTGDPTDLTADQVSTILDGATDPFVRTSAAGSGITQLTGDVTAGPGSGSQAATLASVITAGGPTGSASVVPVITYDAKGRLTTVTTATITPGAIGAPSGSGTSSGSNTGDQTITLTGDVTGSGTGSFAATIAADAVTLAKQADVATGTVFYRKTAGTGNPEVQTLATLKTDLGLTGTNSGDQTSIVGITGSLSDFNTALTGADFATGGGTVTGASSGTNSGDVTLAGTPDYITISGQVITRGQIDLTTDVTGRLPFANIATVGASRIMGRGSAGGTGAMEEITLGTGLSMSGTTLNGPSVSGTNTGDQTIANTSDATSHTVTLSASGGSVQLIEGTNITLTTGGTSGAGTVTIAASGGGLSDGDKGDITVSGSGATWNIDAGTVGTTELGGDITAAGEALLDDANAAAQRTTLGLGTAAVVNTGTGASDVPTITNADARYALIQKPLISLPIYDVLGTNLTWTNMPAAVTWLGSATAGRPINMVDLTDYTEARILVHMGGTGGAAGSELAVRYVATGSASNNAGDFLTLGSSEVEVGINFTATWSASSWIPLVSGATEEVLVGVIGKDGDGAVDPIIQKVLIQFR